MNLDIEPQFVFKSHTVAKIHCKQMLSCTVEGQKSPCLYFPNHVADEITVLYTSGDINLDGTHHPQKIAKASVLTFSDGTDYTVSLDGNIPTQPFETIFSHLFRNEQDKINMSVEKK